MARIRTIKPEFWTNEDLSGLPSDTHLLAGALLNYADDRGFFNANPGLVKAACCPLRGPALENIPEALDQLAGVRYVVLGRGSDGKSYGRVTKFDEHQRVSHPTPSKISSLDILWNDSGNPPEPLPNDSALKGREGKGKKHSGSPGVDPPADLFGSRAERLKQVTEDAVAAYNARLGKPHGNLPAVHLVNDVRVRNVKRCIDTARQICRQLYNSPTIQPKFWEDYFGEVDKDDFRAGRRAGGRGHESWKPDFEYLTRPDVMSAVFDKAMSEDEAA